VPTQSDQPHRTPKEQAARPAPGDPLTGDCARCFGLCCVALPFAASADFAADKRAGEPCRNLRADFGCGIHDRLRDSGYRGCTVYDCFGAGQHLSQRTFGGVDWRTDPGQARRMFAVFPVARALHELLRYVTEALGRPETRPVHPGLEAARRALTALADGTPDALAALDVTAVREETNPLLQQAGELVGARFARRRRNHRGADLMGARLRSADLRGACLRGARLIAADLTRSDLRGADFTGADLRDADLSGADLRDGVFLTQPQVTAARGDAATRLPPTVTRPGHW
jgi:uncharacterized protein YjbI with pentapeptide repeats